MNRYSSQKFDYIGIVISFLCGIHCLVTPLLIISAPTIGRGLQSPWLHTVLISIMAYAFYHSIYKSFKKHNSKKPLTFGSIGFVLILVTYFNEVFFHGDSHHESEHGHSHGEVHGDETYILIIAIVGAILLITSHWINIKKCKCLAD